MTEPSWRDDPSRDVEAQGGGADDGVPPSQHIESRPLRRRNSSATPPAPPPRPLLSDMTPAPVPRIEGPSGLLLVTRYLWILSFLVGLGAIAIAFLSRNRIMEDLLNLLDEVAPQYPTETITAAASVVFWACLVLLGIVIGVESLLLGGLLRRRLAARLGMLLVLVLHIGVALLAEAFLAGGDQGWYLRIFLAAQLLLAAAGLVIAVLARGSRSTEDQRLEAG